MHNLFFGTGVAHTILLLAFVIGVGLYLGRLKVKGVSLGSTWILFAGILMGHLGFEADAEVLHFVKEFGLILFVFSIGLQVGPGFFHSFRSGGVKMNLFAAMNVLLAVLMTWGIAEVTDTDLGTMTGVMSGAVTNTPGLGAAQQTYVDVATSMGGDPIAASASAGSLASGYAVAYPMGVLGVILAILLLRPLGYDIHTDVFADHSWYFRNALVRANYINEHKHIKVNPLFLIRFYRNWIFGERWDLRNRYLAIHPTLAWLEQPNLADELEPKKSLKH